MEIVHRISDHIDSKLKINLEEIGIVVEEGLSTFEISESDNRWNIVKSLIEQNKMFEFVYTKFSKNEIFDSKFLVIEPEWHLGYPMPDEDFGYLKLTYSLDEHCFKCGVGKRQRSPFKMKNEPNWGNKNMLQLNWIFDEYFIKPEIYDKIFKPLGVQKLPVLHYSSGKELKTVVQIKIPNNSEVSLYKNDLPYEKCNECNRIKYLPHTRGMFPRIIKVKGNYIFKTKENFGSGSRSYKEIIINQKLGRIFIENEVKGIHFKPIIS